MKIEFFIYLKKQVMISSEKIDDIVGACNKLEALTKTCIELNKKYNNVYAEYQKISDSYYETEDKGKRLINNLTQASNEITYKDYADLSPRKKSLVNRLAYNNEDDELGFDPIRINNTSIKMSEWISDLAKLQSSLADKRNSFETASCAYVLAKKDLSDIKKEIDTNMAIIRNALSDLAC